MMDEFFEDDYEPDDSGLTGVMIAMTIGVSLGTIVAYLWGFFG